MSWTVSVPDVVDVEVLRGAAASADAAPDLLVEVPHGADRRAHYDALRSRLVGDLPADLHEFFHVNTDVGAWQLGRRIAEHALGARPQTVAVVLRCRIPRTFVDCNRVEEAKDELASGGMTAGLAPYIRDPRDRALLLDLHRRYVRVAEEAFDQVCGNGGVALIPHTYGPVTLGIERVDDDIVANLRDAHAPGREWPVRPQFDLLTREVGGGLLAPQGACSAIRAALPEVEVAECQTYSLHPSTLGWRWASRWPGRTLSFEVRRDLIVREWTWNQEMDVDPESVERFAAPLGTLVARWLASGAVY